MAKTQPEPVRDPKADHLLTPQNCVLVLIDYQPEQYSSVTSSSREEITLNAVALCKLAQAYGIPVVLSTVAVDMGVNEGTIPEIRAALPGVEEIDRTGVNAWEDDDFRKAVQDTGRRKVVIGALWTEVCLAFPMLDMLAEGYEVYPVADAVGGISPAACRAFDRMIQAGARPITAISFGCEIMRNWARGDSDKLREVMRWYFPQHRRLHKSLDGSGGAPISTGLTAA
ncbi:isochorismatase family protein [Bradyrhizobium vignae]|uniref:isochorismatase family protein n=1 Tax=Bradyrhizobium vignae TaxID=1549949 RepID=UPI00100B9899|nr:isochorismatase family protein [Bradyrhizobium vignae]RXG89303.1 isochorismatase family protein [Bradyrhizobium vignae]